MKGAFLAVLMLLASAAAQTSYPPPAPGRQPAAPSAPAQVDLNQLLTQLEQTSLAINGTVARLRVEKWKTGGEEKSRLQANADSIQRNIQAALPGMISAVRTTPTDVAAQFTLYRNVSALYDVFSSLTEAAGAFGPKEDFRDLAQLGQQLDALRHNLGDQVEQVATSQQAEVTRLRSQVRQLSTPPPPPKKIIVDNGEPEKPVKKKKSSKPAAEQSSTQPQQ